LRPAETLLSSEACGPKSKGRGFVRRQDQFSKQHTQPTEKVEIFRVTFALGRVGRTWRMFRKKMAAPSPFGAFPFRALTVPETGAGQFN